MLPETKELPVVKEIFADLERTIKEEFPKYVESMSPKYGQYSSAYEFFQKIPTARQVVQRTENWIQHRVSIEEKRASEYGIPFTKEEIKKIELSALPSAAKDSLNWAISITKLVGDIKYKPEIFSLPYRKREEYTNKLKQAGVL